MFIGKNRERCNAERSAFINFTKKTSMKRTLFYSMLFFMAVFSAGCVKEIKDKITGGTMTAKVNGNDFKASNVSAMYSSNGHFDISGSMDNGREILISIPDANTKAASYSIDGSYRTAGYYLDKNTTKPIDAVSGTVTITLRDNNKAASGTFSIKLKDGTEITDGSYDANWN